LSYPVLTLDLYRIFSRDATGHCRLYPMISIRWGCFPRRRFNAAAVHKFAFVLAQIPGIRVINHISDRFEEGEP